MLDEGATIKIPEFAYDALGRRIRKSDCVADTNTLYYYNDNWQVLCEYNGGGSFERMFMYGNYIDEPIMTYSGGIYFYVQDHLYSTAALVDTSGYERERRRALRIRRQRPGPYTRCQLRRRCGWCKRLR